MAIYLVKFEHLMRKYLYTLAVVLILTACAKVEKKQGFRTHSTMTDSFTNGKWYVSNFVKNGDDTNPYADYNFNFTLDNKIVITLDKKTYQGTWSVPGIEGNDSILPVDKDFVINIGSGIFKEINRDWVICDREMDEMTLIRTIPNQKPVDSLTFAKR